MDKNIQFTLKELMALKRNDSLTVSGIDIVKRADSEGDIFYDIVIMDPPATEKLVHPDWEEYKEAEEKALLSTKAIHKIDATNTAAAKLTNLLNREKLQIHDDYYADRRGRVFKTNLSNTVKTRFVNNEAKIAKLEELVFDMKQELDDLHIQSILNKHK